MENLPYELLLEIYNHSISTNAHIDFIILLEHEITHRAIFQNNCTPQMS